MAFLSWSSEASWMLAPGRQADIFAVSAVYQASFPLPSRLLEYSWETDTSYMGCLLQRQLKVALGYMVPAPPTLEGPKDRSLVWGERLFSVAF